jgi:hypothetical protein
MAGQSAGQHQTTTGLLDSLKSSSHANVIRPPSRAPFVSPAVLMTQAASVHSPAVANFLGKQPTVRPGAISANSLRQLFDRSEPLTTDAAPSYTPSLSAP